MKIPIKIYEEIKPYDPAGKYLILNKAEVSNINGVLYIIWQQTTTE